MTRKKTTYVDGLNEFIKKTLVGLVLGIAWVTPGLSAGIITAATGLYEPIIHALVNLPREYRKSIRFLFPLGLGTGCGILLFSRVMQELLVVARYPVLYLFLGLVAGGVPALFKEANQHGFRLCFGGAALFTFGLVMLTGQLISGFSGTNGPAALNSFTALLSGAILAFGSVVPGISASLILVYLGLYEQFLAAFTGFNLRVLALMGVGFALFALFLLKLVALLFRKYRGFAYYGVLGVLVGSMVLTFPGIRPGMNLVLDLLLFSAGAALSFGTVHVSRQDKR